MLEDWPRALPAEAQLFLRPVGLLRADTAAALIAAGQARLLAGGPLAFPSCEVILRRGAETRRAVASLPELRRWAGTAPPPLGETVERRLDLLTRPRREVGARPQLMGILNATPDSFSDPGEDLDPAAAMDHARELIAAGAAILDIGGESTRPGAQAVAPETEIRRVDPLLRGLAAERARLPGLRLSIDTRRAAVMRHALALGVDLINDVSALTDDPESLAVAAASRARVVLVHKQGDPATMNVAPRYGDVALDVFDALEERIAACAAAGIERARLILDPGIGFGKRSAENLEILRSLSLYHGLGCPLLLGFSRKALIGGEQRRLEPKQRLPGSLAAAMHALDQGVQMLRVHDVAETRQVVDLWAEIHAPAPGRTAPKA